MIFSLIIFTVAISLLSIVWNSMSSQYELTYGLGTGLMQLELNNLVQSLQGQGIPNNWNNAVGVNSVATWSNVTIGLGSGSAGTISVDKAMALMAMSNYNYQATKQLLGVSYDYHIVIDSPGQFNISMGADPAAGNSTAVQYAVVPVVLDNGAAASMEIEVWSNTTAGVG
jgi:hypothetical protein